MRASSYTKVPVATLQIELTNKHYVSQSSLNCYRNILHESGDFLYNRELSQCSTTTDVSGTTYCKYEGWTSDVGSKSDYCSATHTTSSDPDGCDCVAVSNTENGFEANKLFFGR